ncbi:TetR/AcrR family transcriptional regulator [Alteribacter populi]|uniref:TetR/AcrR family transcriptional regulator n=1 Tax=Alteribacter populi TaxID=2011011 RepID=UPI000BBAA4EC|nr:TetR/AcrR family transcriptional regulator [Alteribacter populi]
MPRGFTEREQEKIRQKLVDAGKYYFSSQGLKKTGVKELTDKAGIAQGSFYRFFQSKELLYFYILEMEEEVIREAVLKQLISTSNVTASLFASVLLKALTMIEKHPLTYRLYTSDDYDYLMRKLPTERLSEHAEQDTMSFTPLLSAWKKQGILKPDLYENVISGVLRGFFLLITHKREIGGDVYDETMTFMAYAIANEIFREGEVER